MPDRPRTRTSQAERRADTRARLLEAAARLFAEHGIDGVSVDSVAEAAERTSGAVYDHFGSKHGLLMAVLERWTHELVSVLSADFSRAVDLDDRLRTVARRVIVRPDAQTRRLLLLEHELRLRGARDERVGAAMEHHLEEARRRLASGFASWIEQGLLPEDSPPPADLALTFRAVVLDLALQSWIAPAGLDVEAVVRMLGVTLRPYSPVPLTA